MQVQIPVYVLIFLLSVLGNVLVMVTLIQNKKMRTVTNVFLLNLAVSDLLLAVFCMPFTIVPVVLRNFVFGAAMCILIRYLQGKAWPPRVLCAVGPFVCFFVVLLDVTHLDVKAPQFSLSLCACVRACGCVCDRERACVHACVA